MQPGRGFDDDRLLALALELDDDPELVAAAASDAELAGRLAAMRADVALIGAQVGAAVPAPEEGYADLSGERWSGLAEFFEPPASVAKPRRERRWWRVIAPVTALVVLALVVGIVAVNGGGGSSSGSSAEVARSAADSAQPATAGQGFSSASTKSQSSRDHDRPHRGGARPLRRHRPGPGAAGLGALQRFAVLRIFKGDAPNVVELEVDNQPADQGRLHLLMLDPVATMQVESASPEPIPSLGTSMDEQGLPGKPLTGRLHLRGRAHHGARARLRHRPGHGQPADPLTLCARSATDRAAALRTGRPPVQGCMMRRWTARSALLPRRQAGVPAAHRPARPARARPRLRRRPQRRAAQGGRRA